MLYSDTHSFNISSHTHMKVGKTSMLKAYNENSFSQDYTPTVLSLPYALPATPQIS